MRAWSAETNAILLAKVGTGKILGIVLLGWFVFLALAASVLPPLDSHLQPTPPVFWGLLTFAVLLAILTVIVVPAYVYQSWLRLPTVPNGTAYGLWVGLESLFLLAVPVGLFFLFLARFVSSVR